MPYIQTLGIVTNDYSLFGGRGHTGELLGNEVIIAIAAAHDVSSVPVVRFGSYSLHEYACMKSVVAALQNGLTPQPFMGMNVRFW